VDPETAVRLLAVQERSDDRSIQDPFLVVGRRLVEQVATHEPSNGRLLRREEPVDDGWIEGGWPLRHARGHRPPPNRNAFSGSRSWSSGTGAERLNTRSVG
jgi:hypothetical protein